MKKLILSAVLLGATYFAQAQTVETVSMGANLVNDQWYSLENGIVSTAEISNWDIAFQIGGLAEAGIRINEAKGVEIYHYGDIEDWDDVIDVSMLTLEPLHNSVISWTEGALIQLGANDPFDYGWGSYEMAAHAVVGTRAFILKLADGTYKKLKIEGLVQGSIYQVYLADLDGSNEINPALDKDDYRNGTEGPVYVYYNVENDEYLDRESVASTAWDFLFTRYKDSAEHPFNPGEFVMSTVSGVLSNPNIEVAQVDGVADVDGFFEWTGQDYTTEIGVIGHDWKHHVPQQGYEFVEDRVYFVKTEVGDVWKVVMTGFGGNATGDFVFTKEKISTSSIAENGMEKPEVVVYPNPTRSNVSLILNNLNTSKVNVSIVNTTGQLVYTQDVEGNNNFEVKNIQVGHLKAGVYMVNVSTDSQQLTQRLLIQ